MAKHNALLLLSMVVLVACSTVPPRISGRSERRRTMGGASSGAGVILRSYNGCSHTTLNPHPPDALFCCDKDKQCWGSLQECMPNCPCHTCGNKGRPSSEAPANPPVQQG